MQERSPGITEAGRGSLHRAQHVRKGPSELREWTEGLLAETPMG